jgi:hypothetical protein
MTLVVALATLAATDAEAQGLSQYTDRMGRCILAGRSILTMHRRTRHPISLRPNAHAWRRVSVKLRRPLQ